MYESRDTLSHYNRRIFKQFINDDAKSEMFDYKKIACGHDDVDYIEEFEKLPDIQIKAHIMLRLAATEKEADDEVDNADDEDEGKDKEEYDPTQRGRWAF